jgi:hypothetical protein
MTSASLSSSLNLNVDVNTLIDQAIKIKEELAKDEISSTDCRNSDSFPNNKNFQIFTKKGFKLTLCQVGEGNEDFLKGIPSSMDAGTPVNYKVFYSNLSTKLKIHNIALVTWKAKNGAHIYWGEVTKADVNRLHALGKEHLHWQNVPELKDNAEHDSAHDGEDKCDVM